MSRNRLIFLSHEVSAHRVGTAKRFYFVILRVLRRASYSDNREINKTSSSQPEVVACM